MILYWAWPPDGAGHAAIAAAVCRRLKTEVLVVRGSKDPGVNRALDHFSIPYVVIERKVDAMRWVVENHRNDFIVWDDYPGTMVDKHVDVYLWRMNRALRMSRPVPTFNTEGTGGLWPLLLLDDDEILSRGEAREALGIPQDQFTIIGVPCTSRPGVVEAAHPDFMLTPDKWWPALKYLRAADHVVGTIGATLYGEVKYLGIDATWIKAPNAPDQAVRIFTGIDVPPAKGGARRLAEAIDALHG